MKEKRNIEKQVHVRNSGETLQINGPIDYMTNILDSEYGVRLLPCVNDGKYTIFLLLKKSSEDVFVRGIFRLYY